MAGEACMRNGGILPGSESEVVISQRAIFCVKSSGTLHRFAYGNAKLRQSGSRVMMCRDATCPSLTAFSIACV